MTYKLNPEIRKIESPVILAFPGGNRCEYPSGVVVAEKVFDKRYLISTIKAVDNKIEIYLNEADTPQINWVGEETISFF